MLPQIITNVPGEKSLALSRRLGEVECRDTTYRGMDWPVFWERADGVNVWDVDGNRFLDMTSAFGVAGLGHGFTGAALRQQSDVLLHAMGDVHPARVKVELCESLSSITFEKWEGKKGKCLFGNSGFEAVEAALKTAVLATGRTGILSFEGGYHGLGYGALLGQGIGWFRKPFEGQLSRVTQRLKFPSKHEGLVGFLEQLKTINGAEIGAVLVEPIQGRGGIVVPPDGFLAELRSWCDAVGAVLIFDEIYTGFWRTGTMFACEWETVVPDLICLGKALSGGFPISVCVGRTEFMDAWPLSHGEALHTSTFLGSPLGCAMAIEAIRRYAEPEIEEAVSGMSHRLRSGLQSLEHSGVVRQIRGRGLMMGIEMDSGERVMSMVKRLLCEGIIVLPDGPSGHVLALTPPLGIIAEEIDFALHSVEHALRDAVTKNSWDRALP